MKRALKKYFFIGLIVLSLLLVVAQEGGDPGIISCAGENSYTVEGFDLTRDSENKINTISSADSGTFKYTRDGKVIELMNIKDSKFVFDEKCLMKNGEFTVDPDADPDQKYRLGEYEYTVPPGSKVVYKKGEKDGKDSVVITQPAGSELKDPELVGDKKNSEVDIVISTDKEGALKTKQGDLQSLLLIEEGKLKKEVTKVYYESRNGELVRYSDSRHFTILSKDGKGEFLVASPNKGDKTYISFSRGDLSLLKDLPTFRITDEQVFSINGDGLGPAISISTSNRFNVGLNAGGGNDLIVGENSVAFQGKNGYAGLNKGNKFNPKLALNGESIYGPNKQSFFIRDGKIYHKDVAIINGVSHADSTVYLTTTMLDNDGKKITDFNIYSSNNNEYVMVPDGVLKGPLDYFFKDGVLVANLVAINQQSLESRNNLATFSDEEKIEIALLGKEVSPAGLEKKIKEIYSRVAPSEKGIHNLINSHRTQQGRTPVAYNKHMSKVARDYSERMFNNRNQEEYGLFHSKKSGIKLLGNQGYWENILFFTTQNEISDAAVAERMREMWWNSQGHKDNILTRGLTQTGVGVYRGYDSSRRQYFYYGTQIFTN